MVCINQWGATLRHQQQISRLMDSIDEGLYGKQDPKEQQKKRAGLEVIARDKVIAVFTDFEGFDCNITLEDNCVLAQIYPPELHSQFDELDVFCRFLDQNSHRIYAHEVRRAPLEKFVLTDHYHDDNHRIKLYHTETRRGMDMFIIRFPGMLVQRPVRWVEIVRDLFIELHTDLKKHAQNKEDD